MATGKRGAVGAGRAVRAASRRSPCGRSAGRGPDRPADGRHRAVRHWRLGRAGLAAESVPASATKTNRAGRRSSRAASRRSRPVPPFEPSVALWPACHANDAQIRVTARARGRRAPCYGAPAAAPPLPGCTASPPQSSRRPARLCVRMRAHARARTCLLARIYKRGRVCISLHTDNRRGRRHPPGPH